MTSFEMAFFKTLQPSAEEGALQGRGPKTNKGKDLPEEAKILLDALNSKDTPENRQRIEEFFDSEAHAKQKEILEEELGGLEVGVSGADRAPYSLDRRMEAKINEWGRELFFKGILPELFQNRSGETFLRQAAQGFKTALWKGGDNDTAPILPGNKLPTNSREAELAALKSIAQFWREILSNTSGKQWVIDNGALPSLTSEALLNMLARGEVDSDHLRVRRIEEFRMNSEMPERHEPHVVVVAGKKSETYGRSTDKKDEGPSLKRTVSLLTPDEQSALQKEEKRILRGRLGILSQLRALQEETGFAQTAMGRVEEALKGYGFQYDLNKGYQESV